ncbi:MAG: terminase small subunit [Clostridia bacterium]|nr:terminase small subunit [Clostridia bacterium]
MLTTRQKRFADAYLAGGDPGEAFREAGYREKNAAAAARRLLAAPTVKAYIQERETTVTERPVADATEILQYLTTVLRGEHGGDRERMKAAELLGKRHGLFSDKVPIDTATVIVVDDLYA